MRQRVQEAAKLPVAPPPPLAARTPKGVVAPTRLSTQLPIRRAVPLAPECGGVGAGGDLAIKGRKVSRQVLERPTSAFPHPHVAARPHRRWGHHSPGVIGPCQSSFKNRLRPERCCKKARHSRATWRRPATSAVELQAVGFRNHMRAFGVSNADVAPPPAGKRTGARATPPHVQAKRRE